MNRSYRAFTLVLSGIALFSALATAAHAAPTAAEITGEIERLTLDDAANVYSGGVMIVGGSQVILPKNLLIDLPANRLTLQQIFAQAPAACKAKGESGLAKSDTCIAGGSGGFATLSGVHTNAGNIIAGDVLIEKGKETAFGVVSYVSYTDGYFRLNGNPGDPTTGVMIRLNDPTSRHTVQAGAGCAGGPNCSPDPRFTLDPDNYTNSFAGGYPLCIPSAVVRTFPGLPAVTGIPAIAPQSTSAAADGTGDLLCPSTNRTPGQIVEPAVNDSRRFAPIMVGDSVTAEGNYEAISGVRFLSAHTTRVNRALSTKNLSDQPDYMFLEEVFIEAPSFQNQRARMLIIGFTTLAPTDVDFWTIHRDPATNAIHEFPLASIQGCDIAAGAGSCGTLGLGGAGGAGNNIFRIRYDVDFLLARTNPQGRYPGGARNDLNPCWQLLNSPRFSTGPNATNPGLCPGATAGTTTGLGITLENNFGIMSPIPHEIQARTGHLLDNPALAGTTIDINGAVATNGQYLFPFGMNLGGIETADFLEVDINLLSTPRTFEGIPWNLDRRLSPGGCQNPGGCEAGPVGSTTFALDPFPYTGLDPRTQADVAGGGTPKGAYNDPNFTNSPLTTPIFGASNRVFSYVRGTPFAGGKYKFDGNNTLLPYVLGSFPADPTLSTINPTPVLSILAPIADEDSASTATGVPVTIDVIANDFPILSAIDPTSVKIVSGPVSGTAVVNLPAGTITYTPTLVYQVGTVTFTYTVADNFGSVSLPGTVTVTIANPPTAVNDTANASTGGVIPINLVANDIAGTGIINLASVTIVSPPTCGSVVNQLNGTVVFTAPATPTVCTFTYRISDTAILPVTSNIATVSVNVTTPPAATGITLFSNLPSPQLAGTSVSFSAAATGGSGSYEYQYWLKDTTGVYSLVKPFSASSTWDWSTTGILAGSYSIAVQARSVGSTAPNGFDVETVKDFYIVANAGPIIPATAVNITTNLPSPQTAGASVTFTGTASGGSGFYEYQFWLKDTSGVYTMMQPFSTSPSWAWNTAGALAGSYTIAVQARSIGSKPPNGFDVENTAPFSIQ